MKSFTDFSGSSVICSGMPEKTKLSRILRACKSRIVSFIVLFSPVTVVSWVVTEVSWSVMVLTVL